MSLITSYPENLRKAFPGSNIISEKPIIITVDDFISKEECEEILRLNFLDIERAGVSDITGGYISDARTAHHKWFTFQDSVFKKIGDRVSSYLGVSLRNSERPSIIRYLPGEEYKPHFDAWDVTTQKGKNHTKQGGQRIWSCILYLNNVEEGGTTSFTDIAETIHPKQGRLLFFSNIHFNNPLRPDDLTRHSGDPVIKGEKWICTLWFRMAGLQDEVNYEYDETLT